MTISEKTAIRLFRASARIEAGRLPDNARKQGDRREILLAVLVGDLLADLIGDLLADLSGASIVKTLDFTVFLEGLLGDLSASFWGDFSSILLADLTRRKTSFTDPLPSTTLGGSRPSSRHDENMRFMPRPHVSMVFRRYRTLAMTGLCGNESSDSSGESNGNSGGKLPEDVLRRRVRTSCASSRVHTQP